MRALLVLPLLLIACQAEPPSSDPAGSELAEAIEGRIEAVASAGGTVRRAAFVVANGVFNSELMAPYDVFHHTLFRDSLDYVEPFVVSPDGQPVVTFEGLSVDAHYSFDTAPAADILVIPSTDGSMDRDLDDAAYMAYVSRTAEAAEWVLTVCDGAFPLAATGLLDGRAATTFPADRAALAARFPAVDVRDDVRLVVDGKYVTSVGGGMSYEPAFWLVEHLWGADRVAGNASGLVWPWDLSTVPHLVVASDSTAAGGAS
ncbi:MAG: DJ-1/PfpI family protein [Bacteroidota bacterium]